jgi:HTH-type transcriptional regulator / antitoxin HipB
MDYPLGTVDQVRPLLQALRRQRGLTQTRLGAALGVTQARVVEIEADPGAVSLQQIMQVLAVLGAELVVRTRDDAAAKGAPKQRQGRW